MLDVEARMRTEEKRIEQRLDQRGVPARVALALRATLVVMAQLPAPARWHAAGHCTFHCEQAVDLDIHAPPQGLLISLTRHGGRLDLHANPNTGEIALTYDPGMLSPGRRILRVVVDVDLQTPDRVRRVLVEDDVGELQLRVDDADLDDALHQLAGELRRLFWTDELI
jgi:hypothetical protein